jgi:uncharacterized membrane protein YjgN (DUF898 family)
MNDQSIFGQNFGQLPEDQNNSQHQPNSNDPNANDPTTSKPKPVFIQFTANGSDYFPIWITNLLLTIVTFGIYGPWAKVRREKFFHQHTIIDGDALDYHGNPVKILIGRIITTVLGLGLYAKEFSTALAIGCAVLLAIIVPFAMQRSIRFRLHNTSYRGLRFGFNGTVVRSYFIASIPVLLVFAAFIVPTVFMGLDKGNEPPPWFFVSFFGFALLYPLFHATWRRYAIEHAHFGTAFAKTTLNSWRFVSIYIIAALIIGGLVAVIIGLAIVGGIGSIFAGVSSMSGAGMASVAIVVGVLFFYSAVLSFMPLVTAMLQNLCWNKTTFVTRTNGERVSDFLCDLSTRKFVGLQLKNVVLTILTLGLYRPYAAVATTRAKLQSVGLSDFRFMDDVVANSEKQDSAMGDEAVDMLDFDFSL